MAHQKGRPESGDTAEMSMEIKIVKSVKDDFSESSGPSQVTHAFISIDGMLFELGRFYEGAYMNEDTGGRLAKVLEFEAELKKGKFRDFDIECRQRDSYIADMEAWIEEVVESWKRVEYKKCSEEVANLVKAGIDTLTQQR